MTSKVTVDAHAGWPLRVDFTHPATGAEMRPVHTVKPGEVFECHVHDGCSVAVTELRKDAEL
jgi:hypothetical protein